MDNCVTTTKRLLEALQVRYTKAYVEDTLLSNADHPSLLAIADTLEKYNIETLAVKITIEKLKEVPLPCIVQIKDGNQEIFVLLTSISNDIISYVHNKNRIIPFSKAEFIKKWTGIALLVEITSETKEPEIEKHLAVQRMRTFLMVGILIVLLGWVAMTFMDMEFTGTRETLFLSFYFLLKAIGILAGVLLLWFEVDGYNPTLQSFCSGGGKVNCNAVLNSKQSKLFNGAISLSVLGFSYFFSTLLIILFSGFSGGSLALASYLSLASLPAIVLSLYYQAAVIKQWCKFCIVVQAVLVLEIAVVLFAGYNQNGIAVETIPLLLALLLLPILVWSWVKPLIEAKKETNIFKRGLKKIKNNPDVLFGLLAKSRKIITPAQDLGISLVNKNTKYDVIKVCNPYCGPCAKAHPILEDLVQKGIINLQILFTSKAEDEHMAKPVRHLLAIDAFGDGLKTQAALDDWYNAEPKDYNLFSNKYPLNGELAQQNHKITKMFDWCETMNITHTPTLFINGYELPNEYSVEDLKEVLV